MKIFELVSSHFFSAPGMAWETCLKKTEVELGLLADVDMLLMEEKGIRGGLCHAIYQHAEAFDDYMKDYDQAMMKNHPI